VVQSGQNLYRISAWYGVNMWRVARCNNILNLNRIYVGQSLCIP
jgi:LysM repeat protein